MTLVVAILVLWYQDHRAMQSKLEGYTTNRSLSWSIDQILGQPDTSTFGDKRTAWASKSKDARIEFVIVEFPYTVNAVGVHVYETYNPGAVVLVHTVDMSGREHLVWNGRDPLLKSGVRGGVAKLRFGQSHRTRRLRIVLDSGAVPGWNEIDAVALEADNGEFQWASKAWASTSYGRNREVPSWFWP